MKRAILAFLGVLALMGTLACAGNDSVKCLQSVQEAFPGGEVKNVPRSEFRYIVRDAEGNIWYAEAMNATDTSMTAKVLVFKK